jgi:hypothetical protein
MQNYGGQQWFNYTDAIDYSYFSGTPSDPLGGGIGTAASLMGNWYQSMPITGTANGSVATAGLYGNGGANISGLYYDDLFGTTSNTSSRALTAHLPVFDTGENPTSSATIYLNGQTRMAARDGRYYNIVQPFKYHKNVPATGINVYSFCFNPEEYQPSGECNFSNLDSASLNITVTSALIASSATAKARIYATNYNILRIAYGMGSLAYLS